MGIRQARCIIRDVPPLSSIFMLFNETASGKQLDTEPYNHKPHCMEYGMDIVHVIIALRTVWNLNIQLNVENFQNTYNDFQI